MNRILWEPGEAGSGPRDLWFDWRPDLERLEKAAEAARRTHNADPWTLAEAECWLDLIEAELIALKHAPPDAVAESSRRQLEAWRKRVEAMIPVLKAGASTCEATSPRPGKSLRPPEPARLLDRVPESAMA